MNVDTKISLPTLSDGVLSTLPEEVSTFICYLQKTIRQQSEQIQQQNEQAQQQDQQIQQLQALVYELEAKLAKKVQIVANLLVVMVSRENQKVCGLSQTKNKELNMGTPGEA